MKTRLELPPRTAALLAERPAATRDVLLQLAEQGLTAARRHLAKMTQLADFEACCVTFYAGTPSRSRQVQRHDGHLKTACATANGIAGAAGSLFTLAATEGVEHPIFAELVTIANRGSKLSLALREAWQSERERILQEEELQLLRFSLAVALVRRAVRGDAADAADQDAVSPASE